LLYFMSCLRIRSIKIISMKTNIFVNLPVKDLEKTKQFFSGLGYTFNPQFTDQNAACMIIDENIYVMLVVNDFFKKLTKHDVVDNSHGVESTTALSMPNKEAVDAWATKALSLGATENTVPEMNIEDFMYGRSMNDLDGHIWEVFWMNPAKVQK
jgi:predicted lactoylglutathione lyase